MSEWQPIETAPKDNIPILAYCKGDVCKVWWQTDFLDGSQYWQNEADSEPQPTHWMPLPEPPAA